MEHNQEILGSMTPRDYLRIIFRHSITIITCFITVIATVIIGLIFKTPVYEAQVKMLISAQKQVDSPYYREIAGYRDLQLALTQSEIVKSTPVLGLAVQALGLYKQPLDYEKNFASPIKKPFIIASAKALYNKMKALTDEQKKEILYQLAIEDLRLNVKVEPLRDTTLFVLSVKNFSPVGSAIIANTISRAYVIFDLQQQLAEVQLKYGDKHPTSMQLKDSIETMSKSLNGQPLPDIEAIGPASVKIIEQSTVPLKPFGPHKALILVLAVFMGLFLGVMLAFTFEYIDQTFKSAEDIERYLALPFLGSIPKRKKHDKIIITNSKRETPYLHFYNTLSEQMYMVMKDKKIKSVLITSALHGEGVSTIILNLGIYLSFTAGHKVLVIDANLRRPSLGDISNVSNTPGLADVIEGKVSFEKAIQDLGPKLHVLSAGVTELNPITFLDSSHMAEIVRIAKEKYEIVLIDCADLRSYRDAVLVSSYVDGAVLVVNEGKTRRHVVQTAIEPLAAKNVNLFGVILNNRTFPIPEKIYKRL